MTTVKERPILFNDEMVRAVTFKVLKIKGAR